MRQARSSGMSSGTFTAPDSCITTVSAKPATAIPRYKVSPRRDSRVVPSGCDAVMRASEFAHNDHSPRTHHGQRPHGAHGVRTTLSPTDRVVTFGPTASTTPDASWPKMIGTSAGNVPSTMLRSLWQTPQWAIRTATSPERGSSISTSSWMTNGVPTCSRTAARIVSRSRDLDRRGGGLGAVVVAPPAGWRSAVGWCCSRRRRGGWESRAVTGLVESTSRL